MATASSKTENPKVVSPAEWLAARKELLAKEKEFTHLRDELSRKRLELPWEIVEKNYVFEGPNGKVSLADLFGSKSQLIVYHFMLGPTWTEGCPGCSFLADHFGGSLPHLAARDVAFVAVSRGAACADRALQEAHGLGLQLGLVQQQRLQFRLPRLVRERRCRKRRDQLQLRHSKSRRRGIARRKLLLQGRSREHFPHVFELRPRPRADDRRLRLARHRP